MNVVTIAGNLGKDAEVRHTPSGSEVASFSVGCKERKRQGEEWVDHTEWIDVILWKPGGRAKFLTRGAKVAVVGRLQKRSWESQDGQKRSKTEVIAEKVYPMGSPQKRSGEYTGQVPASQPSDGPISDDDIPF